MRFPWSKGSPVYPYHLVPPRNITLGPLSPDALRQAVAEQLVIRLVPERLDSPEPYEWGWAWFDNANPVLAGSWLCWMVRAWVKKPPRSLVEAMTEERVRDYLKENPGFKITKEWRQEQRDEVVKQLCIRTAPAIEETPVVLDPEHGVLLLFTSSSRVRKALTARLSRILAPMVDHHPVGLTFQPWNLQEYLKETRPSAVLPEEVEFRFLTWLTIQAAHGRWMEAAEVGSSEPKHVRLELDASVKMSVADGETTITGEKAAEEAVFEDMEDGDGDEAAKARAMVSRLYLRVKGGRDYVVKLNALGEVTACRLVSGETFKRKEDELENAMLDRVNDYFNAAKVVRLLYGAFDYGPLQKMMEAAPQRMLFPGAPTGFFVFRDPIEGEDEDLPPEPDEEERNPQASLFGDNPDVAGGLARALLQGPEFAARVSEQGLNLQSAEVVRAAHLEDLVAEYVQGGWSDVLAYLRRNGVADAKSGPKTIRRMAMEEKKTLSSEEYEAEWAKMQVHWRDRVGGMGFNLQKALSKVSGSIGVRRKMVDAYIMGGHQAGDWDEAAAWAAVGEALTAENVPLKKSVK